MARSLVFAPALILAPGMGGSGEFQIATPLKSLIAARLGRLKPDKGGPAPFSPRSHAMVFQPG
jgi:hypothetical protein